MTDTTSKGRPRDGAVQQYVEQIRIMLIDSSTRVDGKPFTKEQMVYMKAFEDGYLDALGQVRSEANK